MFRYNAANASTAGTNTTNAGIADADTTDNSGHCKALNQSRKSNSVPGAGDG
jgi:hypothetical protein